MADWYRSAQLWGEGWDFDEGKQFAYHAWSSFTYTRWLAKMNPDKVFSIESSFNLLVRRWTSEELRTEWRYAVKQGLVIWVIFFQWLFNLERYQNSGHRCYSCIYLCHYCIEFWKRIPYFMLDLCLSRRFCGQLKPSISLSLGMVYDYLLFEAEAGCGSNSIPFAEEGSNRLVRHSITPMRSYPAIWNELQTEILALDTGSGVAL